MQNLVMGSSANSTAARAKAGGVRVKTIALPVEHGGWGIALEPVLLGLALAPSMQGALLAIATLAAFLSRHPLKILAADRRNHRRFSRTRVAERFVLIYGGAAALAFAAAIASGSIKFLLPLALAAPLALIQLKYDTAGRSRRLLPELSGSVAMASVAASIAIAAGWSNLTAFALWAVLSARVVPTILYVRARLALVHGKAADRILPTISHVAGLALVSFLAWMKLMPLLAVLAFALLLVRATQALFSESGRRVTAKRVGFSEIFFGAIMILFIIVGHFAGI